MAKVSKHTVSKPMVLEVRAEASLSEDERSALAHPTLDNFAHFCRYSSRATELFFAKVTDGGRFVGAAPVVRLKNRPCTDQLVPALHRWLWPLGLVARKSTYLIDTAFLAFEYRSPFFAVDETAVCSVRSAIIHYLRSQRDADNLWISEPTGDHHWAQQEGFFSFAMLPMMQIDLDGCQTLDEFVARMTKKRRRNYRIDQELFAKHRATIETISWPATADDMATMIDCLKASERRASIHVPYNDILIDDRAFAQQPQTALVARVDNRLIGFMSFIRSGHTLLQCHGGFDYHHSLAAKAYANLMYASIDYALSHGFAKIGLGPLNNETKRRVANQTLPVTAHLWNRNPVDAWIAKTVFVKNFQVYSGQIKERNA